MVPRDPTGMWTFARKGHHTIPPFLYLNFNEITFAVIKYAIQPIPRTIIIN